METYLDGDICICQRVDGALFAFATAPTYSFNANFVFVPKTENSQGKVDGIDCEINERRSGGVANVCTKSPLIAGDTRRRHRMQIAKIGVLA